jgi:hypothetical protein
MKRNPIEIGVDVSDKTNYGFNGRKLFLITALLMLSVGIAAAQQQHEYVDLGLPSGTLWATCNVGANNPEDYGDFFAWGETTTKEGFFIPNYKYANGEYKKVTKYCPKKKNGVNGYTDNLTTLESSDDAASTNWGSGWCMPTQQQFQELADKCTWTQTTQNGKNGFEVKGPNGNSIFLPAAGRYNGKALIGDGTDGYYWSSELNIDRPYNARSLDINPISGNLGVMPFMEDHRSVGRPVRPVWSK